MKKTLALLLVSSALLVACGAEEPEAAEEAVNDSATEEEVAETEEQSEVSAEEDASDTGNDTDYGEVDDDMYFSIHYHQGDVEVENRLEDASDIAGLHTVTLPEEYRENRHFPQETFIDIKEDGRATVLSYEVADISFDEETGMMQDENVIANLANTEVSEDAPFRYVYDSIRSTNENYITDNKAQFMYVDEQGNLLLTDEPVPFRIEMATGYMVQEYGEIQFKKVEQAELHPHLDKQGELTFSSLLNNVSDFIRSDYAHVDEGLQNYVISPLEFTLETASLTEANRDAVRLPFLLHQKGMRSASQVWDLVSLDYNERVEKAMQTDAFADDPHQPYVENHSDLMHYLIHNDSDFGAGSIDIANNPSDYIGYTQDNTEIVPEVVFINDSGDARTLRDDGTIWAYNSENGTWDRAEYSLF